MKATTSKENGIWVIKLYLDKNETLTDKNKAKAYKKVDEAFENIKETKIFEKVLRPIMKKDKLIKKEKIKCIHESLAFTHIKKSSIYCTYCGEFIK
jgi:hypothetical protein